jgi:hypothetical protein
MLVLGEGRRLKTEGRGVLQDPVGKQLRRPPAEHARLVPEAVQYRLHLLAHVREQVTQSFEPLRTLVHASEQPEQPQPADPARHRVDRRRMQAGRQRTDLRAEGLDQRCSGVELTHGV